MKQTLFIDTNILLDVLLKREDFYLDARRILELSQDKNCLLVVSVLSIANIAYVLRKKLKGDELYDSLKDLTDILSVVSITKEHCDNAIKLKATDFEDALQYYCAESCRCDAIITRNKKDFIGYSKIPVYTSAEYLEKVK